MSYENLAGMNPITLPATTGLPQYTLVGLNGSGQLVAATTGAPVVGVTHDGTTDSTARNACKIYPVGCVAPVQFAASTVKAGDFVTVGASGLADDGNGSTEWVIGQVVRGSSGGANRVLSVLLTNSGLQ
jgi:hypothetical protein